MQYNTAGQPMGFFDQCAHCGTDTGGQHQPGCAFHERMAALPFDCKVTIIEQMQKDGWPPPPEVTP